MPSQVHWWVTHGYNHAPSYLPNSFSLQFKNRTHEADTYATDRIISINQEVQIQKGSNCTHDWGPVVTRYAHIQALAKNYQVSRKSQGVEHTVYASGWTCGQSLEYKGKTLSTASCQAENIYYYIFGPYWQGLICLKKFFINIAQVFSSYADADVVLLSLRDSFYKSLARNYTVGDAVLLGLRFFFISL